MSTLFFVEHIEVVVGVVSYVVLYKGYVGVVLRQRVGVGHGGAACPRLGDYRITGIFNISASLEPTGK